MNLLGLFLRGRDATIKLFAWFVALWCGAGACFLLWCAFCIGTGRWRSDRPVPDAALFLLGAVLCPLFAWFCIRVVLPRIRRDQDRQLEFIREHGGPRHALNVFLFGEPGGTGAGAAPSRPKREWREKARALRAAHAGDPAGPDPAPAVFADPAWRGARTVGLYLRQGPAEPDTAGLLAACRREGKAVAVPAWDGAAKAYFWAALAPDEALAAGPMGISQPAAPRRVETAAVDLFVVPGLLFDETGTRLGHGAGHVDRLLAGRRPGATVLGLAFPWQVLPSGERLPREATDVPADRMMVAPFSACPGPREGV